MDLSPLLEHRGTGDIKSLLKPLQFQLVHLLIAGLHLDRVEGQLRELLHVLKRESDSSMSVER